MGERVGKAAYEAMLARAKGKLLFPVALGGTTTFVEVPRAEVERVLGEWDEHGLGPVEVGWEGNEEGASLVHYDGFEALARRR